MEMLSSYKTTVVNLTVVLANCAESFLTVNRWSLAFNVYISQADNRKRCLKHEFRSPQMKFARAGEHCSRSKTVESNEEAEEHAVYG